MSEEPALCRSDGVQRADIDAFDAGEAADRRCLESTEAVEERRLLPWLVLLSSRLCRMRWLLLLLAPPLLGISSLPPRVSARASSSTGLGITQDFALAMTQEGAPGKRARLAVSPAADESRSRDSKPSCCQNSARFSIPLLSLLTRTRMSTPVFLPRWAVASAGLVLSAPPAASPHSRLSALAPPAASPSPRHCVDLTVPRATDGDKSAKEGKAIEDKGKSKAEEAQDTYGEGGRSGRGGGRGEGKCRHGKQRCKC